MIKLKELAWVGSTRSDLQALPEDVQDEIGYALYQAQSGLFPDSAKPWKGLKDVIEIVCDYNKDTYRTVYVTKLGDKIYILHFVQKKSKTRIKTPPKDIALIKSRLQLAKNDAGVK